MIVASSMCGSKVGFRQLAMEVDESSCLLLMDCADSIVVAYQEGMTMTGSAKAAEVKASMSRSNVKTACVKALHHTFVESRLVR